MSLRPFRSGKFHASRRFGLVRMTLQCDGRVESVNLGLAETQEHFASTQALRAGNDTILAEARALEVLAGSLGEFFVSAVELLAGTKGRVVVTGMGKSGHVGRKIAATMASTGTPALFVHPGEASHGDLGMVTSDDIILALSNSGETAELRDILFYARRHGIPLIGMAGRAPSTLVDASTIALIIPPVGEACPMGLAPTTSTTCMLALGDALAVALLQRKGFTKGDFAVFHPGGKLGSQLLRVDELMHKESDIPLVGIDAKVGEAVLEMSEKRLGCVGVVDANGELAGIVTDGDLRRHMANDVITRPVASIMTKNPRTIGPKAMAADALNEMNNADRGVITVLFVVEDSKPVGALHLHDCLKAGIA